MGVGGFVRDASMPEYNHYLLELPYLDALRLTLIKVGDDGGDVAQVWFDGSPARPPAGRHPRESFAGGSS